MGLNLHLLVADEVEVEADEPADQLGKEEDQVMKTETDDSPV